MECEKWEGTAREGVPRPTEPVLSLLLLMATESGKGHPYTS